MIDLLPFSHLTDDELLVRIYLSSNASPLVLELAARLQHSLDELNGEAAMAPDLEAILERHEPAVEAAPEAALKVALKAALARHQRDLAGAVEGRGGGVTTALFNNLCDTKAHMSTPEGKVKDAVKKVLKAHGVFYYMPVQNGMGQVGIPDFICCFNGRFWAIETKAPGKRGNTTANQDRVIEAINAAGGVAVVIDDAKQLEELVNAHCRHTTQDRLQYLVPRKLSQAGAGPERPEHHTAPASQRPAQGAAPRVDKGEPE